MQAPFMARKHLQSVRHKLKVQHAGAQDHPRRRQTASTRQGQNEPGCSKEKASVSLSGSYSQSLGVIINKNRHRIQKLTTSYWHWLCMRRVGKHPHCGRLLCIEPEEPEEAAMELLPDTCRAPVAPLRSYAEQLRQSVQDVGAADRSKCHPARCTARVQQCRHSYLKGLYLGAWLYAGAYYHHRSSSAKGAPCEQQGQLWQFGNDPDQPDPQHGR